MKKLAFLLAVLLALTSCTGAAASRSAAEESRPAASAPLEPEPASVSEPEPAEPEPEPDNGWTLDAPENHGMDPAVFARLHEALTDSSVYAMVTAKDGVLIDEYYGEGYDETSVFPLHSCSKSFTGALVGIAIEQGILGGVDDPLSDYLPQMAELEDVRKGQITLRHLLTHTSGLEWYEWGGGQSNWAEFQSAPDWVDYILGRRLTAEPGAVFNYSTGNTHLLSAALQQAAGKSLLEYGRENLFEPLGMDSAAWRADPQGVTDGGNGISMTARDAARFGQLYLEDGVWNGRRLIPADWLAQSTAAQNNGAGDGTGGYGYQWWVRSFGDGGYDAYYAFGAWGQYIFVVPELDLVTVIASHYPQNSYAPRPFFTDYVLAAYDGRRSE